MSDHEYMDETGAVRRYVKRRMTPKDWVSTIGGVLAIMTVLGGAVGAAAGALPALLGLAGQAQVNANTARIENVESTVVEIALAQQEDLELTLLSRIDDIEVQIEAIDDQTRLRSLQASRNELDQRLERARDLIKIYRAKLTEDQL